MGETYLYEPKCLNKTKTLKTKQKRKEIDEEAASRPPKSRKEQKNLLLESRSPLSSFLCTSKTPLMRYWHLQIARIRMT